MNLRLPAPMPEASCLSPASLASRRLQTGGAGRGLEANLGVAALLSVPELGPAPPVRAPRQTRTAATRDAKGRAPVTPLLSKAPFSHFFLLGSLNCPATPALPEGFWRGNGERGTYRSPVSPEYQVGIFWFQGGGWVVPKRPLVGEEPRPRERPRIPHPQGTRIGCGSQQRTERGLEGACQQRTTCWKVRSRAPAGCFSAWNLVKPVTCCPLLAAANIAILAIGAGAGACFPWFHLKERWKILWDHQAWAPVRALSGPELFLHFANRL